MDETFPFVLACDVGNSAIHFASIQGEVVSPVQVFRHGELAELGPALVELWNELPQPKKIVASSVNPAGLRALEAAIAAAITRPATPYSPAGHESVLVVGRDLPLPIDTDLSNPEQIGTDRLCAAVAAFDRLGVACVVADFGSAITIDCVNDSGVFMGGAILPGLAMSAKLLGDKTAQLPVVELSQPDWVYGKDTRQAIVGGLIFGARGALRELTESYATALEHWPVIVITGGDAHLICPAPAESELVQAIVPDLTIRGIAAAYYRTLLK
jgi:type III pantothenate kinase